MTDEEVTEARPYERTSAEVADLKHGLTALEERARNDLGMVAVNETFFQVVDATHRTPDGEATIPESLQASTKP